MNSSIDWDAANIERLEALWAAAHSTAAIGRLMGISKNAVVGKAHRLGLPPRPSPIKRDPDAPPKMVQAPRAPKCTLPKLHCTDVVQVVAAPVKTTLRAQPCCWPLGDPGSKAFRFCGAAGVPGKPYCAPHCKTAYAPLAGRTA